MDYTLQNHGVKAPVSLMEREVENSVIAIKEELENLAYRGNSAIPVVFQLAAPAYFESTDWDLLMRVDHLKTYEEFLRMMKGVPSLIGYGLNSLDRIMICIAIRTFCTNQQVSIP